jgi:hypothetical protein
MAGLGAGRVLLRTIGFPSKAQALQAERAYHLWLGRDNSHSEWHSKQKFYDPEGKTTTKIWYGFVLAESGHSFKLTQGKGAE